MVTGDWGWVSSSIPRFKNPLGGMVHGWHQIVHQMALFYPQHPQPSWDFQKPSSRNRGTGFVPPGASSPPLARRCLRRNARKAQLRWTGDGEKSTWKARKKQEFLGKQHEIIWRSMKIKKISGKYMGNGKIILSNVTGNRISSYVFHLLGTVQRDLS